MNFIKQQIGWILFGTAFVAGIALLLSAPRSITTPDRPQPPESSTADSDRNRFNTPLNLQPLLEPDPIRTDQNPFRPPERWSSMHPQDLPTPPLPELTLPKPIFVLPTPSPQGIRWSPLFDEIKPPQNDTSQIQSQLNSIASNIHSSDDASGKRKIREKYIPFDKVYLEGQEEWVKGKITDKSKNFITFRFLSSGQIKRFNREEVQLKKAHNPVESFHKDLQTQQNIENEQELNNLVNRAIELGLLSEAADLVKQFAQKELSDNQLFLRAATLYRQGGKPYKAIETLQIALRKKNATKHKLLFRIARNQWELGLQNRALTSLKKSIEHRPLFFKARLLRFLYVYDLGNPSQTETELNKMKSEISGMAQHTPEVKLYHFAEALYEWSYTARSADQFSMDKLPAPSDVSDAYSFAWPQAITLRSRLQLAKGNTENAINTLANGLQKFETSYPMWYNLGVIGRATNQQKLAKIAFSACHQIAPHRIEHRLTQASVNGETNQSAQLEAVYSHNHEFLLSYYRARTALSSTADSTSSPSPGDENTSDSADNPFSGGDDPGASDANGDSEVSDNTNDSPFANETTSDDTQESPPAASTGDEEVSIKSGTRGGQKQSNQTTLERFKTVYREIPSFNPGSLGLAYQMIEDNQAKSALPLLRHQVPDSWFKHFLLSYALAMENQYKAAFQQLKTLTDSSNKNTQAAYQRALRAYLLVKLKRTKQASELFNTSINNEQVSSYVSKLTNAIEQSRQRRVLDETFDRSNTNQASFIGIGWTATPDSSGVTIRRQDGRVSFSGTLNSNVKVPRISRPTNEQFISAEFTGKAPSASDDLYVGAGLVDTSGTTPEPLSLIAFNPNNPASEILVQSGSFSPLDNWTSLQKLQSGSPEKQKSQSGSFSIRIERDNTSSEATWTAEINNREVQLDAVAPNQFNRSSRSVMFFVIGSEGTSVRVHLDRFRLVHQIKQ